MTNKRLLNTVIIISGLVLATSYFLPVEGEWAPVDAWLGYCSGGEFVSGFNIGLVEAFPFAVGVIVLLAMALCRWPKVSFFAMVVFAMAWVISVVLEVSRIVRSPYLEFQSLWLALAVVIILGIVIISLVCLRGSPHMTRHIRLGAILATWSILQQSYSIAYYLLEDRLLLNIGSVTGVAAAVLLVSLLCVTEDNSQAQKVKTREPINLRILLVTVLIAGVIVFAVVSYIQRYDIHAAAQQGNLEKIKSILARKPELVSSRDRSGRTPLHLVVQGGHKTIIEFLIASRADVNAKDIKKNTPLHYAVSGACTLDVIHPVPDGHRKEVVELLIGAGAEVNAKNKYGGTALAIAAAGGRTETVKLLLAKGADVNAKAQSGETPLYGAVGYFGNKEVTELLIANGAEVNAENPLKRTPLFAAVEAGNKATVEVLLANGADVNVKEFPSSRTPLHYVGLEVARDDSDCKEIIKLLLKEGAKVNAKDNGDRTPLHYLVEGGYKNCVEFIVGNGADVNAKTYRGQTPLHLACGEERVMTYFPSTIRLEVNAIDRKDIVDFLLSNGAEVNARDSDNRTPLSYAISFGRQDVADLLRKYSGAE